MACAASRSTIYGQTQSMTCTTTQLHVHGTHISLWRLLLSFLFSLWHAGHVSLEAFIIIFPSVTVSAKSWTTLNPEPQCILNASLNTQVGCTRGASWQPIRQGCRCVCLWSDHVGDPDLAGSLGRPGALAGTALPLSKACDKDTA